MRQKRQQGFTVIELLIAAAAAVIILAGVALVMGTGFRQSTSGMKATQAQTNLQAVYRMLTNALRGADPTLSTGHNGGSGCAHIATALHWVAYCNTAAGATRSETPRHPSDTSPPQSTGGEALTGSGGSISISKSDTQFLITVRTSENSDGHQLAVTTRVGGN